MTECHYGTLSGEVLGGGGEQERLVVKGGRRDRLGRLGRFQLKCQYMGKTRRWGEEEEVGNENHARG